MPRYERIEQVIQALYDCISGPAGEERHWSTHRELMHPASRSMRTGVDADGAPWVQAMDAERYEADTRPFFAENDFYEIEIARDEQIFGNVASVRSVYEARRHPDDPEVIKRGVNFIHLYHDGSRWWVMNILWDNEREGLEVPADWS